MRIFGEREPFQSSLTRNERILGWSYLPLHLILLPLILNLYVSILAPAVSETMINAVYYGIGLAYTLVFLRKFLRREFDPLLDRKLPNLLLVIAGWFLNMLLSYAALFLVELLSSLLGPPDEEALEAMASVDYRPMIGLVIFLAPVIEETLFRGVVFGTIAQKSRFLGYLVSAVLFSVYHIWQYALAFSDASLLVYALQYFPASIVLAWLYERSGSLWVPILFHVVVNLLAVAVM